METYGKKDIVLGEVWKQDIGEYYYKHTVHKFSYLYVEYLGLAIAKHGHHESANTGRQIRKVNEWYVFPDVQFSFVEKMKNISFIIKSISSYFYLTF